MLGSSAGGEHPKFTVWSGERHLLVKDAGREEAGPLVTRWRDLLVAEAIALRVLESAAITAARAEWVDIDGMRFLEVERFDRVGARGRCGVVSLGAWDNAFVGVHGTWTRVAVQMHTLRQLQAEDARRLRWLDVFGELIGNTDRHLWNVTLFWDLDGPPALAPVYDMLPMLFAPGPTGIVERPYSAAAPTSATFDVWGEAARVAATFWDQVAREQAISGPFRARAAECGEVLERQRGAFAHLVAGG